MESKRVVEGTSLVEAKGLRDRYIGSLRSADVGKRVTVCGWVARVREHGEHLVFVDVRDYSGIVQVVAHSSVELRSEFVVRVSGTVTKRPQGTDNPSLATGEIELTDTEIEVLSEAEPSPFSLQDRVEVDEATRLRFRFLD